MGQVERARGGRGERAREAELAGTPNIRAGTTPLQSGTRASRTAELGRLLVVVSKVCQWSKR